MKKLLFFVGLLLPMVGFAQDWAPYKLNDSIRHFVALDSHGTYHNFELKPIQSIVVDSSFTNGFGLVKQFEKGFSIFKLYNNALFGDDIIKGRILGDQIQYYQDSLVVSSVDSFGFQLTFPLRYQVGQTFNFGYSLDHKLLAICDSMYIDSVDGQLDSVAKISLIVYDQRLVVDSIHHFNCSYIISKNHGLIRTPDFTNLDSLFYFKPYFNLEENLNCNRTFDLTVGDEYHYYTDTNNFWTLSWNFILHSHYGYKIKVVGDTNSGTIRTLT